MKFPKFGKHNKAPQVHKTKEELIADLKKNADFLVKMKFVREQFKPALEKAATSIQDAQFLLQGFNSQIMESFLAMMKDKKVGELNLEAKLDSKSPKYEEFKLLLALFSDMSVFDAKSHIEGMKGDIEKNLLDENSKRQLSELKWRWIDES